MTDFAIALAVEPRNGLCGMCGEAALWKKGPRVCVLESGTPVCRECARHHAPQHFALLDLALSAEKAGKATKHLLTPPMETLLELNRAAETFAMAFPSPMRRAS